MVVRLRLVWQDFQKNNFQKNRAKNEGMAHDGRHTHFIV